MDLMAKLQSVVDHPYLLILALALSVPCFVVLASMIFPDPEEDAREDAKLVPFALLGGGPIPILGVKLALFFIVGVALAVTFYKVGSWIIELF